MLFHLATKKQLPKGRTLSAQRPGFLRSLDPEIPRLQAMT